MWKIKHYRLGFDLWGLGLFLLIMIPNFVWFTLPAPNDILRAESATPLLDAVAQILQAAMAVTLCAVINTARDTPMRGGYRAGTAACVVLYFAGWAVYYTGFTSAAVGLTLCLAPCGAFLFYSAARGNAPALLAAGGFAVCHLISTVVNFIR